MKEVVVGVDIGGTKIAGAVVTRQGEIIERLTVPSEGKLGGSKVMANLVTLIDELLDNTKHQVRAIGVGTAGEVDPMSGVITSATDNIPNWSGSDLAGLCVNHWNLPIRVDNDANAAALAELWYGAGRGVSNFVYLCLGTGVGGAVISQSKLLRGAHNYAGALGHITICYNGRPCNCGSTGCLEAYVSGSAIGEMAKKRLVSKEIVDARTLFSLVQAGDQEALQLVDEVGGYLGCGLASIANSFDPSLIIIGGGVGEVGELLLSRAREVLQQRVLAGLKGEVQLKQAALGNDSGVIGGAVLAWQTLDRIKE